MKDNVEYLSWRLNYDCDPDRKQWINGVEDYILHLEKTINTLRGELELCCVEPIEYSFETIAKSCFNILEDSAKYKSSFKTPPNDTVIVDMEKRLLDIL